MILKTLAVVAGVILIVAVAVIAATGNLAVGFGFFMAGILLLSFGLGA